MCAAAIATTLIAVSCCAHEAKIPPVSGRVLTPDGAPALRRPTSAPAEIDYDEIRAMRAVTASLTGSKIGLPRYLAKSDEMLVVVTASGGHTTITALTPGSTPDRVARLLEGTLHKAGLKSGVPARQNIECYSSASAVALNARYGATTAANRVPIGHIAQSFRESGLSSYVLLRVPRYARIADPHLPREVYPKNTWYNATNVAPDLVATVRTELPCGTPMLVAYLGHFLPAVGLCSFVLGFGVGLHPKLSAQERVAGYDWLTMMIPLLCGLACGVSDLALESSPLSHSLGDVWLGKPNVDLIFVRTLIFAGVLSLVMPLAALGLRGRVLRGLDDEPDLPDLNRVLRRGRRLATIGLACLVSYTLYVILSRSFEFSMTGSVGRLGPAVMGLISPAIMHFVMLDLFRPSKPDAGLTERAQQLAAAFGAAVRQVRIATGGYAKKNPNALALPGKRRIIVTRKAVEALSPREMDWLLAHEISHFGDKRVYKALFPAQITAAAGVLVPWTFLAFGNFGYSVFPMAVLGIVPVLALLATSDILEVRRRLEYEADIQAMVTVRDLDAAISGLVALKDNSQHPKLQDTELDVHPKLMKRIKALRQVAAELGITETGPCESTQSHLC